MGPMDVFKNLTDFSYQRSWKQALAFYVIAVALTGVVGMVTGLVAGTASGIDTAEALKEFSPRISLVVSTFFSLVFALVIMLRKNLRGTRDFVAVLAALGLGLLGAVPGMIPVAYLSTRPRQEAP